MTPNHKAAIEMLRHSADTGGCTRHRVRKTGSDHPQQRRYTR